MSYCRNDMSNRELYIKVHFLKSMFTVEYITYKYYNSVVCVDFNVKCPYVWPYPR